MLGQPVFRRRIGQRLDMPGLAVDLFGGLQRVAAIDENGGLARQDDRHAGRAGKAGEPGQPLFGGRDIFVLLLIGAGNHESRQLPPRQLLAKGGQPGGERHTAFGFFECLEMGFEHHVVTLESGGAVRNAAELATIWHNPCFTISVRASRMERFCSVGRSAQDTGRLQECFNSTKRGCTMPAFTFEKISPPTDRGPTPPVANKKQRGVVVKMLDRFAEARVKRSLKKGVIVRNPDRPSK